MEERDVREEEGVRARWGRWLEGSDCLVGAAAELRRGAADDFEDLYIEKSMAGGRWKPEPYPTNEEGSEE
jgi:hypothetical protein